MGLKDIFCAEGLETTCASKILKGYVPPYDATSVALLKGAGAVILGKLNMDEFAMGSANAYSAFGPCRNPWDTERVPGGSSGGSAAAVAARLCYAALGTDTGGSIRQPAALTGTVGLKPTYGRVSRYGVIAFASSLDQVGPFGRTTRDVASVLEIIARHDPADATSVPAADGDYLGKLEDGIAGMRLGVPREYFVEGTDPEVTAAVRAAIDWYADNGAEIVEVSLPHTDYGIATYYIVAPSEASSNLARYDGVRYGRRAGDPGRPQGPLPPLALRGLRRRGEAPDHARDLRPVRRLLRRLLPQGPEGPGPGPARLRPGLRDRSTPCSPPPRPPRRGRPGRRPTTRSPCTSPTCSPWR